jgi:hypothetical protein
MAEVETDRPIIGKGVEGLYIDSVEGPHALAGPMVEDQ